VSGLGGQGIFTIHEITFGLETCLDHWWGRLRSSPPAVGDLYPQIHLIPSFGMDIEEQSVACSHGGVIFLVDRQEVSVDTNVGSYELPRLRSKADPRYQAQKTSDLKQCLYAIDDAMMQTYFGNHGVIKLFRKIAIPPSAEAAGLTTNRGRFSREVPTRITS
jgi:hypothetical protein